MVTLGCSIEPLALSQVHLVMLVPSVEDVKDLQHSLKQLGDVVPSVCGLAASVTNVT